MHRATIAITASAVLATAGSAGVTYRTIALMGKQAPGCAPGVAFKTFGTSVINEAGSVAFSAILSGPGVTTVNDSGIWSNRSGSLDLVWREGDPAPGLDGLTLHAGSPWLTESGAIVFWGSLSGQGVTFSNSTCFVSDASGAFSILWRKGDPAPGLDGVFLGSPRSNAVIDAGGQVTVSSELTGNVDSTNDEAFWTTRNGVVELVARAGDSAPFAAPGVTHAFYFPSPVISPAGTIVFNTNLAAESGDSLGFGLWASTSAATSVIALPGDPAPDVSGYALEALLQPQINSREEIVFLGKLVGPGPLGSADAAWMVTESGVSLIVHELEQAPGMPEGVRFSFLGDVRLTDAGEVLFSAQMSGPGIDANNASALWLYKDGDRRMLVRSGETLRGTNSPLAYTHAKARRTRSGQTYFAARLRSGMDVAVVLDQGGQAYPIITSGRVFDVNDNPTASDLRVVSDFDFGIETSCSNGLRSRFNDAGDLVFAAEFADNTEGVFVATIAPSPCRADIIRDGITDAADFSLLAANFGGVTNQFTDGDLNGDGVVNVADFAILAGDFGCGAE